MPTFYEKALFSGYLNENEKIFIVIHRHWIFVLKIMIIITIIGLFVPVAIWYLHPELWLYLIAWIILSYAILFYKLADWYYDSWVVTNHGIIAIIWNGIFARSAYRIDFNFIEGVAYQQKGALNRILGFGDVAVVKMGDSHSMILRGANNPKMVEKKVMDYREIALRERNFQDEETLKDILSGIIKRHIDKNGVSL